MSSNKGITLASLAIYIVLVFIVLGILAVVTTNFNSNIKLISGENAAIAEVDKFNMYFIQEVKKQGNNVQSISDNEIFFTTGNKYTYNSTDNSIYLQEGNNRIKIAEKITKCIFSKRLENGKTIITVVVKVDKSDEITNEYVLNNEQINSNYQDEKNYTTTWEDVAKPATWSNNVRAVTDGTNTIPLPQGYKISDIEGENAVEGGLVIKDNQENEFVWIPVQNPVINISSSINSIDEIASNYGNPPNFGQVKTALTTQIQINQNTQYPLAAKLGNGHYIGIGYLFDQTGEVSKLALANSGITYIEPIPVRHKYAFYKEGTEYDALYSNLQIALTVQELNGIDENSTAEECASHFSNILKNDFDAMAVSVEKYGGFYVGRYETGGFDSSKVVSKSGENTTSTTTNTWYKMYKMQKEFINNEILGSSMIWGCQYDQVMRFVNGSLDGTGTVFNVGTSNSRNSGTTVNTKTGENSIDKVRNIYDLEGNKHEITMEGNSNIFRTMRGGDYNYNNAASYRTNNTASITEKTGSRMVLYIK